MEINGTQPNILKAIYDRITGNIILNGEELKAFPPRSRAIQGSRAMHCHHCSSVQCQESYPKQLVKKKTKESRMENQKQKYHYMQMLIYRENPKGYQKLLTKMAILPKAIDNLNDFSQENRTSNYKIYNEPQIAKTILQRRTMEVSYFLTFLYINSNQSYLVL